MSRNLAEISTRKTEADTLRAVRDKLLTIELENGVSLEAIKAEVRKLADELKIEADELSKV
ncbi:MAG: hypothetical protein LBN97_07960 [Oscillospiraceae bacterium]|jgi:hypothetical protein|nr:hypothetical protein [Oscillospiraceae bacterium]